MKRIALLAFIPLTCFGARILSITLDFSNAALSDVLNHLSNESNVNFVYSSEFGSRSVSVSLQNVDLETALRMVLLPLNLDFEKITKDTYVILNLSKYGSMPRYAATYDPRYVSPEMLSKILDKMKIENYVLGGRLTYYVFSHNQLMQVRNVLSKLDTEHDENSQSVLLKITYLSTSELRTLKELSIEDLGKILFTERYTTFSTTTHYVLFNYTLKQSNSTPYSLNDPTVTTEETTLGRYELNEGDFRISLIVLGKGNNVIINASNEFSQVEVPVLENVREENLSGAVLKSGNFLVFIEANRIDSSMWTGKNGLTTEIEKVKKATDGKLLLNSFEVFLNETRAKISLSNDNKRFSLELANSTETGMIGWNVESSSMFVNILSGTYIGISYNFPKNSFRLLLEDEIKIFDQLSVTPQISYDFTNGSFSIKVWADFTLSFSQTRLLLSTRISREYTANTVNLGFTAALGFGINTGEYWVGLYVEDRKLGFYGSVKW
ncbi:STN domain-containing protein [Fervidobacterium islandicum]|uniref:STN domain-containing protein n=1 Tax=Fervidobacterium islandicum TaxID=2423 RepID=A0AAI8CMY8_FERIS|nr:STN domain-containing protein [Fervidobacterium islandicum]AMW33186.1 STN domain-containing protein [Fervidobacterium islandicum]